LAILRKKKRNENVSGCGFLNQNPKSPEKNENRKKAKKKQLIENQKHTEYQIIS